MKFRSLCILSAGLAWLLGAAPAFANGSCTITSVAVASQTYSSFTTVNSTGTVNYTCTRTSNAADGSPITFNVTADGGSNYSGGTRRATNTGNYINYSLLVGGTAWGDGVTAGIGNASVVSVTFTGGATSKSGSFNFTLRVPAFQFPPTRPDPYTDTFNVRGTCTTAKGRPCTVTGNSEQVSIMAPTTCTITTSPTTFTLPYTAFQSTTARNNTPFAVRCTNRGTYRMSVGPTGATVLGITYSLKLDTAANSTNDVSSTTTYNLTGTGGSTNYYVNAAAVPGQPGTCSGGACTQLGPIHTLLVEF